MSESEIIPRILLADLRFPMGIAFDSDGHLWFGESQRSTIGRMDIETGQLTRFEVDSSPSAIAIDAYHRIWFADPSQHAIRRFDPQDKHIHTLADHVYNQPLQHPQQLLFDRCGNLIFACSGQNADAADGYVCCLEPNGTIEQIANELASPGGLALIHDGQTLFIAESDECKIWRGDWDDQSCIWIDDVAWAKNLPGQPVALAMGVDGRLYVATHNGQILALSADGYVVESIVLHDVQPTAIAFDLSGQHGLVIADSQNGQLISLPGLGLGTPLFNAGAAWPL